MTKQEVAVTSTTLTTLDQADKEEVKHKVEINQEQEVKQDEEEKHEKAVVPSNFEEEEKKSDSEEEKIQVVKFKQVHRRYHIGDLL